jgi:hypothetical protein
MFEQFGKDSHQAALRSASRLKKRLSALTAEYSLKISVFRANATDSREILSNIRPRSVDIVFTDVPYGQHSQWQGIDSNGLSVPLNAMLEALLGMLSSSSILAIVSDKQQKVAHERFARIEKFQAGKRRIIILRPA